MGTYEECGFYWNVEIIDEHTPQGFKLDYIYIYIYIIIDLYLSSN